MASEHDKEMDREEEFFYRGQVRGGNKYYDAIRMLAEAIHRRLEELGVEMGPQAKPLAIPAPAHNGRTVFVAKPARDMNAAYETLTAELTRSGYRVLPDPALELPDFRIGKSGIEKAHDLELRGSAGTDEIEVWAALTRVP